MVPTPTQATAPDPVLPSVWGALGRHGPVAVVAFVLVWQLGQLVQQLPAALRQEGERITAAIREGTAAELRAIEQMELRTREQMQRLEARIAERK